MENKGIACQTEDFVFWPMNFFHLVEFLSLICPSSENYLIIHVIQK